MSVSVSSHLNYTPNLLMSQSTSFCIKSGIFIIFFKPCSCFKMFWAWSPVSIKDFSRKQWDPFCNNLNSTQWNVQTWRSNWYLSWSTSRDRALCEERFMSQFDSWSIHTLYTIIVFSESYMWYYGTRK